MEVFTRVIYLKHIIAYSAVYLREMPVFMLVRSEWLETMDEYSGDVWLKCFSHLCEAKRRSKKGAHFDFLSRLLHRDRKDTIDRAFKFSLPSKKLDWSRLAEEAVFRGRSEVVLLMVRALPMDLMEGSFQESWGYSNMEVIQSYLNRGFVLKGREETQRALDDACQGNTSDIVQKLLTLGATPTRDNTAALIQRREYSMARFFIENCHVRVSPNCPPHQSHISMIVRSTDSMSEELYAFIEYLISIGERAHVDANLSNCSISRAISMGDSRLLSMLISNLEGKDRRSALNIIHLKRNTFDKEDERAQLFLLKVNKELKG